jgi:general secretion pathway protein K
MRSCVTASSSSATHTEAGFVLVAVLWILAALAALASIYSSYTINTAAASRVVDDRLQAEASIRAGVEMAVFRQLALPEKARPAWGGFNLRVGCTGVAVRFRSEAARIDLNAAPVDLLAGLFIALGVDSFRAETFAERIVGWRTKAKASGDANAAGEGVNGAGGGANVASVNANAPSSDANTGGANANPAGLSAVEDPAAKEDRLYSEENMPYPPRHAPFDDALELSLLPGIPLGLVERVLPFVTVFSGSAEVDVFTADPTILSAFPEMTPKILNAVLTTRASDPDDGAALLAVLGPAQARATVDKSKVFRASISVEFDNGRRVHAEVVVRLKDQGIKDQNAKDRNTKGQADEPYELLFWRDDLDGPI